MERVQTGIHPLPEIEISKMDNLPLSIVSFFHLSAKSGSGRRICFLLFHFVLQNRYWGKKNKSLIFWLWFYFQQQMKELHRRL